VGNPGTAGKRGNGKSAECYVLPSQRHSVAALGIFARQRRWEKDLSVTGSKVFVEQHPDLIDVLPQSVDQTLRQGNLALLASLAVANVYLPVVEVDILDPQPNALHQPHATAI
jgi:hypothetical protein